MKLEDLAKTIAGCNYEELPDDVELPVNVRYQFRYMGVQSKDHDQEASATLVLDPNKTDSALALVGAALGHEGHASIDTRDVKPPLQFAGTFHTHLAATTSTTVTSGSVKDFARYIDTHDGRKVAVISNTATKTTGPLAYSTVDLMTFVKPWDGLGREHFSFLFCLPSTLYMLAWAKDSIYNVDRLYEDVAKHSFEEIFIEVIRETFGLTKQDSFNLDLQELGPLMAPQCLPLTTIIAAGKAYKFGVYAAHVPLEGLNEASFQSSEPSVQLATHQAIQLKRFKS
jgi:hypothetical protein